MKPVIERFMEKVDFGADDGECCWNWTACKASGYGRFWTSGTSFQAHRFLIAHIIPEGMHACHHCDNRKCVRPSHIFIGTRSDNMRDCVSKGRHRCIEGVMASHQVPGRYYYGKGESHYNSTMKESDVRLIKALPYRKGIVRLLGKLFNVHEAHISAIRHGKRWGHISVTEKDIEESKRLLSNI